MGRTDSDMTAIMRLEETFRKIFEKDGTHFWQGMILFRMCQACDPEIPLVPEKKGMFDILCALSERIECLMYETDDPRYTIEDYADAIVNLPAANRHLHDLAKISEEDFFDLAPEIAGLYRDHMSEGYPCDWSTADAVEQKIQAALKRAA